ncbi:hypothetical protein [Parendozoicomonas sp. Alg238-R29]|uniref:hypothetical protein n=1 Tax=Parendozoicomonas sp. Alg238-R29 TaxID=2993446 RepID=UPI00248F2890|nr:hypothetical protein [Parendozoicomonas sp. Alg238-R29]
MLFEIFPITKPFIPRPPDFARVARSVNLDISGSKLHFKLPKHKSDYSQERPVVAKADLYDFTRYKVDIEKDRQYLPLLSRAWRMNGPLFHENVGELFFFCGIEYCEENDQSSSFFQYEILENIVLDKVRNEYGRNENTFYHGQQIHSAPHKWQVIQLGDHPAVQFEIHREYGKYRYYVAHYPITHNHYLIFMMKDNSQWRRNKNDKPVVDTKPIDHFFSQIMDSVSIQLSDVAQAQKDTIDARYPDQQYTPYRAPEKWTTDEQDKEYAEHCEWLKELKALSESGKNGTFKAES